MGSPEASYSTDLEDLLGRLRRLPDVWPRPPPIWVPRKLKQQVAAMLRESLEVAIGTAGAVDGSLDAEVAHRLARCMPQLFLRSPPSCPEHDVPESWQHSTLRVLRARLRSARSGDWVALVQDALDELAADAPDADCPPPRALDQAAPLTQRRAQAAVLRARSGALKSAAAQLTGGPPVPPSNAARTMVEELFPDPLDDDQASHLTRALEAAQSVGLHQRLRVTPRLIGHQLAMLKPAAGPGPSGYRNSHILCIASDPAGHQTLQAWADLWARGSIAPWLAALWTPSMARPFWKDKRQLSVRPVLCGEALLKFAMGVCVLGSSRQVLAAVGPSQHGVGGNPEQIVGQVRAAAAHRPDRALLSLDFKNAFGCVQWADALDGLVASAPRLAVPVARQWALRSTQVFVQVSPGQWEPISVTGGLTQGFAEAQPIFCIVLTADMRKVLNDPALKLYADPLHLDWAYVDDWTLQVDLDKVAMVKDTIVAHASRYGLQLQPQKCQLHVPAFRNVPEDQWPEALRVAAQAFPVNTDGITLLGTEATSQFEMTLAMNPTSEEAAARLANVIQLADRLLEVLSLTPCAGAKQAVWTLNRCVVAQALSYDYRVLPSVLVMPHAESLEKVVVNIAAAVLGQSYQELSDSQRIQFHLPTRCAGLQITRPTVIAPLARVASLVEAGPSLRAALAAWPDCTEQQACLYDGVDDEVNSGLVRTLRGHGIAALAGDGTPAGACSTPTNPDLPSPVTRAGLIHASQSAADMRPPVPARHLLSAMLRHVADGTYEQLLANASDEELPRLRSAAGPTAGASLVAPLSTPGVAFTDEEWEGALRRRIGLPTVGPMQPHGMRFCQNWNATKAAYCGEPLDTAGCHASICPCGPLTNLCHDGLSDRWCDILDETGLCTRRDLYVPSLSTPLREAWLDIGTFGPGELGQQLFDITVRHPGASRYASSAADADAATAEHGERDKAQRYGSTVVALVHESWGRLNDAAESLLAAAAEAAARLDWRRGRTPGQRLQRWRAQLDADLQRAQVGMQHAAVQGLPGRAHKRPAPLDLPALQTTGHWPDRRH